MMYAPHILYKKKEAKLKLDGQGKPVPQSGVEWVNVGVCRCDDNTTQELRSDNGQAYWSRYHVVYPKSNAIKEGDEIRCLDLDGNVRGQGIVGMVKSTNYLGYSELWT